MLRARAEREDHQHERDHDQKDVDPPMRFGGVWVNSGRHGKESEVGSQKSEVTSQRSEVTSQKSVVSGQIAKAGRGRMKSVEELSG